MLVRRISPAAHGTGLTVVVGPMPFPGHPDRDKLASRAERYRVLFHDCDRQVTPSPGVVDAIVPERR